MAAVLDAISSPLKRYLTSLLQSYLSTYIKGIELEGACRAHATDPPHVRALTSNLACTGLGVLGSELVLQHLDLRLDAVQVRLA